MVEEGQGQGERGALKVDVLECPDHEFQGLFFLARTEHEIDEAGDEAYAEGSRSVLEILPVVPEPSVPFFAVKASKKARRPLGDRLHPIRTYDR